MKLWLVNDNTKDIEEYKASEGCTIEDKPYPYLLYKIESVDRSSIKAKEAKLIADLNYRRVWIYNGRELVYGTLGQSLRSNIPYMRSTGQYVVFLFFSIIKGIIIYPPKYLDIIKVMLLETFAPLGITADYYEEHNWLERAELLREDMLTYAKV